MFFEKEDDEAKITLIDDDKVVVSNKTRQDSIEINCNSCIEKPPPDSRCRRWLLYARVTMSLMINNSTLLKLRPY